MIEIALSVLSLAACYKWGAWRRWREFYPSILYLISGNLAYNYVFHEFLLWEYKSFFGHTFTGLIINFIIYPPVVILYLANYPQTRVKQALYILAFSAAGTLIEAAALITGGIYYENGWTIIWSFVLFIGLFALVRLHYKRPLLVWPISLALGVMFAIIFRLPYPP